MVKKVEEFSLLTPQQKVDKCMQVRNGYRKANGVWVAPYPAGKLRDKLDIYIKELERKVK